MESISKFWPGWNVEGILGSGGFGKVYKASRENFGDIDYSAIKVVSIPGDPQEIEDMTSSGLSEASIKEYYYNSVLDMVSEIKMMSKFKSASHIVSIEDYHVVEKPNTVGWTIYIRMELLTNILKHYKEHPATVEEVVKMATHILTALEFCHERHIIHRDIKPGNIFISEFGEYKLGDFGISREAEKTNAAMSQKGTKSYMAPEIIRLDQYGKNVDLYALGLTMYELLNYGRMPFLPPYPQTFYPKDREEAVVRRLSGEIVPDIEGIGELNTILKKACHPDKNQRYQNATEMKEDLLNYNSKGEIKVVPQTIDEDKTIIKNTWMFEDKTANDMQDRTMGVFDTSSSIFKENQESKIIYNDEQTLGVFSKEPVKEDFLFENTVGVLKGYEPVKDHLEMMKIEDIKCEICGNKMYPVFPNVYACRNIGTPDYNSETKKIEYINPCRNKDVLIELQRDPKTLEFIRLHQKYISSKNPEERIELIHQIYHLAPNDYHTISYVESMYWNSITSFGTNFHYKNALALTYKLCDYHIKHKDYMSLEPILERVKFKSAFYKSAWVKSVSNYITEIFKQYMELYEIVKDKGSETELLNCFKKINTVKFQDPAIENGCSVCGGESEMIIPGIEECKTCGQILNFKEQTKTYNEYMELINHQGNQNYEFEPAWSRRLYYSGVTRDQMIQIVKKRKFGARHMQEFFRNNVQGVFKDPNLLNEAKKAYNIEEKVLCAYTPSASIFGRFEKNKDEYTLIFTELGIYFKINQEIHTIYYFELDGYKFQNGLFGHLIIKGNQQRFELKCNLEATSFAQLVIASIKKHLYIH